jgi:L-alanine-DL-glutamate epimerase-like enolase superfamily enzyme
MQLDLKIYSLPLKHTFSISRESYDSQETLITSLSLNPETSLPAHHLGSEPMKKGYGEATSNPYYGITAESMLAEIEAIRKEIENFEFTEPEAFHNFLRAKGLGNFAICALDLAAWDLYGKIKGKPLYELWGTSLEKYPISNYTIGLDTIDKMVFKMQETPWPIYKIKLGTDDDMAIIKALRNHTDAIFRIDANCAWSAKETILNAPQLKELGVEFLEQPLKADDWEGMEQVIHQCVLPIIADESCIVESDVERCGLHFNGINIKLTKCGGLTPALRMIKKGKELGLKVMVGCMTESTVGISAVAQLLPQLDYVDMDGAMLLKEDIAQGVALDENGSVIFSSLAGSGISLI